ALDTRDISVVPVVFLSSHCPRGGGAYADGLSLGLVAAPCGSLLRNGAAIGGGSRSRRPVSYRRTQGTGPDGRDEIVGPQATGASQETRARAGPLRQRSAGHYRLGEPSRWCRDPRDTGLYGQDGAEGRRPRHTSR